jgi:hypothetical protein
MMVSPLRETHAPRSYDITDCLNEDELTSHIVLRILRMHHMDISSKHLDYWCRNGWVTAINGETERGSSNRRFDQHGFRKVWFMHHLTNVMGFGSRKAAIFAEKLAQESVDANKAMLWVTYKNVTMGIPNIGVFDGNSRN